MRYINARYFLTYLLVFCSLCFLQGLGRQRPGFGVAYVCVCVVCVEVVATDVRQDVEGDERDAGSIRRDDRRGRQPREVVTRQVRVPARIDDERLL